jgi:OOP family OmpA-OmpF porin
MKKQSLALVAALALMTSACATLCDEEDMCTKQENVVFRTSPANFAFDSAVLTAEDKAGLDKVVERMKANPDEKATVKGYTDITGPASYNVDLSQRRAAAVKKYLVDNGVAANRVATKGYGATNFVATNETLAGRAENRRAEVVID